MNTPHFHHRDALHRFTSQPGTTPNSSSLDHQLRQESRPQESAHMSKYLSDKLRILALVMALLVVLSHSYFEQVKFVSVVLHEGPGHMVMFIETFLSRVIARVAVPLFFTMSGYLFFSTLHFSLRGILDKYKKRFKSLLMPYLIWSIAGLVLFLILQSLPSSRDFFTRELVRDYSAKQLVNTILFDPIPYQLWYVRDLIFLVIFAPVIGLLTKLTRGWWILLLILLWFLEPKSFKLFSNEALLFFAIGCYFGIGKSKEILNWDTSRFAPYLLVVWLLLSCITAYYLILYGIDRTSDTLSNVSTLVGIAAVWSCYDFLHGARPAGILSRLAAYSFIIYALHEPLLTMVRKGVVHLWGEFGSPLFIYFSAPILTISICVVLGALWKRHEPGSYFIATGGR